MTKQILFAFVFFFTGCICHSQTPNAVTMKLEPFPNENWYINISGKYGQMDYENNKFLKDTFLLRLSNFLGVEGNENVERAISILYKWGGSRYEIEIISDLGVSNKYKVNFSSIIDLVGSSLRNDDEVENEELHKYHREHRAIEAFAVVKGQPIGLRLFEQGKTEPFKEVRYDDPGEPPKLRVTETIFVPKGIPQDPSSASFRELEGEGYRARIIPSNLASQTTDISYDEGITWARCSGLGSVAWRSDQLARTEHPIIKFTAYSRMRRYVKYYTYKKGFSDQPGGPYEPITMAGTPDDTETTEAEITTNASN